MEHCTQSFSNLSNVETNDSKIEVDLAQYAKKTMHDKDYRLFEMLMETNEKQIKALLVELDADGRESMAEFRTHLRGMLNEGAFKVGVVNA